MAPFPNKNIDVTLELMQEYISPFYVGLATISFCLLKFYKI